MGIDTDIHRDIDTAEEIDIIIYVVIINIDAIDINIDRCSYRYRDRYR